MELVAYPNGLPPLETPAHGWNTTRECGFRGEQVNLGINERTWPDFVGTKSVTNGFPNAYSWRSFLQAWDRFGQIAAWRGDNLCLLPVFTYMMVEFQTPEMKMLPSGSDIYANDRRGGQELIDRTDRDLFLVMLLEASKRGAKIMADFMIQAVTEKTAASWASRYGTTTNGLMLSASADGRPFRTFSGATFPNPVHPAVRKAYVEFCEGMGRRYGQYPAFAGIAHRFWPSWPASFESWFYDDNLGYDDFTVGEFSKATGLAVAPVGSDPEKFAARRDELRTRYRRAWFAWRGEVCLSLREEMLAALHKHAPNAKFLIHHPHDYYRRRAPGSGLDSELFANRRDLGFLNNRATIGAGGNSFGTEINNLDPACFAAFDRRDPSERIPSLEDWNGRSLDFPQGACCDGSMRPYPYNLEPAALALADNKLEYLMTQGCWTLPAADVHLREFVRAYRAIPDGVAWTSADLPGGDKSPVAVWSGEKDGTLVFWLVNRTDAPRKVELAFDASASLEDYVTGRPADEIVVPPYGVRVFAAAGAKRIVSVVLPMDESERALIRENFAFLAANRQAAAGAREERLGGGEEYFDNSGPLGCDDLSWTFDDLLSPISRAAADGDWHEVRRGVSDLRKNHAWWHEIIGWPTDFCKVRQTGDGTPLAAALTNATSVAFADPTSVATAALPFASAPFVVAPKGNPVVLRCWDVPGGRRRLELTGVFGGGYGDLDVTVDGRVCGVIRATAAEPRLETRSLALDFPHPESVNEIVLTAQGAKGLAILSLGLVKPLPRPLDRWMAIGPFDKGGDTHDAASYEKVFPPEETVDFAASYDGGVRGKRVAWREVDTKGRRTINLMDWTPYDLMGENGVTYLVTYVKAQKACSTMLSYSNDFFGTIWVNGEPVVPKMNGPLKGYGDVEVRLNAGWNEIKVKTACGSAQRWYFAAAIADDGTFEYKPGADRMAIYQQ